MRQTDIIKKYLWAAGIMVFFAAFVIFSPHHQKPQPAEWTATISEASVQHEIFKDNTFEVRQTAGVKIYHPQTGRYVYYFDYVANKQDTLRRIAALPFLKDNRPSSLTCELMDSPLNPLEPPALSAEEKEATAFFWEAQAETFTFYECYKSPVKHTLLLSKTSDRILHKVEFI